MADPKFIPDCTLPLTGRNVVDMIVTEYVRVQPRADHASPFRLIELAPGVTVDEVDRQGDGNVRGGDGLIATLRFERRTASLYGSSWAKSKDRT